jgi:hypothetical protein
VKTPSSQPYTPPDSALSPKAQVREVVTSLAPKLTLATVSQQRPSFGNAAVDSVLGRLLGAGRARQTPAIDFTDESGIHWVGTITAAALSVTLDVTGTTATTSVRLTYTTSFDSTDLRSTSRVVGTLPAQGGTVALDLSGTTESRLDLANGVLTLTSTMVGWAELRDAGGVVQSRHEQDTRTVTTLTGGVVHSTSTFTRTDSQRAGEGLFWVRTRGDLTMDGTPGEPATIVGTVTGEASNGMTFTATFSADGTVSGEVRDASGQVVGSVSGDYRTGPVTVTYADGTSETIHLV